MAKRKAISRSAVVAPPLNAGASSCIISTRPPQLHSNSLHSSSRHCAGQNSLAVFSSVYSPTKLLQQCLPTNPLPPYYRCLHNIAFTFYLRAYVIVFQSLCSDLGQLLGLVLCQSWSLEIIHETLIVVRESRRECSYDYFSSFFMEIRQFLSFFYGDTTIYLFFWRYDNLSFFFMEIRQFPSFFKTFVNRTTSIVIDIANHRSTQNVTLKKYYYKRSIQN